MPILPQQSGNMGTFQKNIYSALQKIIQDTWLIVASKCEYSWIADIVKQNWCDLNV